MTRELEHCRITREDENTICCEFTKNLFFTADIARNIFSECDDMMDGQYVIIWMMHTKLKPDNEVMDAFAEPARAVRVIAEAFHLEKTSLRLMANFYFRVKRPAVPGKVFETRREAEEWLKSKALVPSR